MRISDWSSDVCSSDLLQSGSGGLDPINAVRKAAGLDRLRILPADSTTGQGTSVAAGKYITRKTYVELITDGQGYSDRKSTRRTPVTNAHLVCRLLLEKKNKNTNITQHTEQLNRQSKE